MKSVNLARKSMPVNKQVEGHPEPEKEPGTSGMRRRKTPKGARSSSSKAPTATATPTKTPLRRVRRKSADKFDFAVLAGERFKILLAAA